MTDPRPATDPCSMALLESALAGALPADEEAALHRHLETCAACCAALEQLAGGSAWGREAALILNRDELDESLPGRDEWSDVDFTVEHLDAADEPNLLGRLGGYDVLEIIGRGGMGVVLKGYDRELKRSVAIKVLAPHLAQSSLARKRFTREAQAAAAVVHPHVLAIHQVQPAGRLPFLVMPLVAGESLAERLAAQGTLELKEILRIGLQAASGLAAAHEQGLVHRDVKPANILLEKGVERAVLTDFGLARAGDDVALTRWGIIAGTPQYMSPEQVRGEPLDGRSDLFSLGCVLYEMATGVSPFRSDSMMATMRRLVDDPPAALASHNPELPGWFVAVVDRLLRKDPAVRFGSAQEVSELLESCLAHVQQPAGAPLPASLAPPEPAGAARRPGRRGFGIATALALFGIVALGVMLAQSAEPPDISGQWSGDEWGQVELKKDRGGEYTSAYSRTVGKQPGEIELKWSPIERRFNGVWREGKDRFGEISVRLLNDEIRGALTTDARSRINPATPRLADLAWVRVRPKPAPGEAARNAPVEPPLIEHLTMPLPGIEKPRVFSQIPAPIFHDGKLQKARNVTYFALEGGKFKAEGLVGDNVAPVKATGRWDHVLSPKSQQVIRNTYRFWFDRHSGNGNGIPTPTDMSREPDYLLSTDDTRRAGFPLVPAANPGAGVAFGPEENGLRLAFELDSHDSEGFVLGKPIDVVFYLRNVSGRPLRTAVDRIQDVKPKIVDEHGEVLTWDSTRSGPRPAPDQQERRCVLTPNSALPFRGVPIEFIAEDQDKPSDAGFDGHYVHVRPGRYTLSYQLSFPDQDGMPSDWRGSLDAGPVMVEVKESAPSPIVAQITEETELGVPFGPVKNGLQALIGDFPRYSQGYLLGEPFRILFVIRNASEKPIVVTNATYNGPTITDADGKELRVHFVRPHGPITEADSLMLDAGQRARGKDATLRFFADETDVAKVPDLGGYYVIAKPGKYQVRWTANVTRGGAPVPFYAPVNPPPVAASAEKPFDVEAPPITVIVREGSPPEPRPPTGSTKSLPPSGKQRTAVTFSTKDGQLEIKTPTHTFTTERLELWPAR